MGSTYKGVPLLDRNDRAAVPHLVLFTSSPIRERLVLFQKGTEAWTFLCGLLRVMGSFSSSDPAARVGASGTCSESECRHILPESPEIGH
jgi:hypothetical protein